jgi:hypothetical protein
MDEMKISSKVSIDADMSKEELMKIRKGDF